MITIRQASIALGSFAAAMSIGFVMQNGSVSAGLVAPAPADPALARAAAYAPTAPELPGAGLAPTLAVATGPEGPASAPPALITPARADAQPFLPGCEIAMQAAPLPNALVALELSAPCHGDQAATLHHKGMMITLRTDAAGAAKLTVPALTEEALFIAAFADGEGAIAQAAVPDFAEVERAVVQWEGQQDFQIHAYEFGADFNAPGHVWQERPGAPGAASAGFLMTLGDAGNDGGLMAQIYTFPARADRAGVIQLEVEAQITEGNCGREVAAQSLQFSPGRAAEAVDLIMTMPGCEAVSDFLILQNMLSDLNIAAG